MFKQEGVCKIPQRRQVDTARPIKFDDIKVFGDLGKNCFRGFVVG